MSKLIFFTIVVSMIPITDAVRGLIKPTLNKTLPHDSGQHRFLSSDLNENVFVTKCDETAVTHALTTSLMKMSGSLEVIWQIDFLPLTKCHQAISAVGMQGVYSFFQSSDPLRSNEDKAENSLTLMKVDLDGNKIFDDVVLRHLCFLDSSFPDSQPPLSPLQTDSGDNLLLLAEVCSERDSEWVTGQVLLIKLQSDGKEVWTRPVATYSREQIQLMSVNIEGKVMLLLSHPRLSTEDKSETQEQDREYCLLHLDSDGSTTHFSCPAALNQIGSHGSLTPSHMYLDASLDLYLLETIFSKSSTESNREVLLKFSHGDFQTPQWTREINDALLKTESLGLTPYQVNRHHSSVLVRDKSGQVFLMSLLLGVMLVSMLTEDGVEHLSSLDLDLSVDATHVADMMFLMDEGRKHLLISYKRTEDQDYSHLAKYVFESITERDHQRAMRVSRRLSGEDDVKFCRDSWTLFGDNCYFFISNALVSWPTCQSFCENMSAEMLCVTGASENAFIVDQLVANSMSYVWIGFNDIASEGNFVWPSGCSSSYTRWLPGNPNNALGNQDYAVLLNTGLWDDGYNDATINCGCQSPSFSFNPTPDPCSPGWTFFDDSCYYVGSTATRWDTCQSECASLSSEMLCINDAREDAFLTKMMNNAGLSLWIGLNDAAVEGDFEWEGTCSSSYTNWWTASGQPNNLNGNQHYVAKYFDESGGPWIDNSIDAVSENIFIVCACESAPIIPIVTCPTGWTLFGENCYYLGSSFVSYTTCKSECTSLSAVMLCIEDVRQDAFLDIMMNSDSGSLWIGFNDALVEGTFEWEGSCSSTYEYWYRGQPDGSGGEHYAGKWSDALGQWNDFTGSYHSLRCACQFPAPTAAPTAVPTITPSYSPTSIPTKQPSTQPSSTPSAQPSSQPSSQPTSQPTSQPSSQPTTQPSMQPSSQPSGDPTSQPSAQPNAPTAAPSLGPTFMPSSVPSAVPTISPTSKPTLSPSANPSTLPTLEPTYDLVWKPLSGPVNKDSPMGFARIHGLSYSTGFTCLYANGTYNLEDFDAFVYKMNSSLIREWRMHMGGAGNDVGLGVASDSDGNVYVTGKTQASRLGFSNLGGSDVFLSKLNVDGVEQWTVQFGSPEDDMGRKIVVQETDGGNDGKTVLVVSGSMGGGVFEAVFNTDGQLLQG